MFFGEGYCRPHAPAQSSPLTGAQTPCSVWGRYQWHSPLNDAVAMLDNDQSSCSISVESCLAIHYDASLCIEAVIEHRLYLLFNNDEALFANDRQRKASVNMLNNAESFLHNKLQGNTFLIWRKNKYQKQPHFGLESFDRFIWFIFVDQCKCFKSSMRKNYTELVYSANCSGEIALSRD